MNGILYLFLHIKFKGVCIYLLTLIFRYDVLVTCVKQVWELDICFCIIKPITNIQLGDTLVKIIHTAEKICTRINAFIQFSYN
jgi:hypothetical protein